MSTNKKGTVKKQTKKEAPVQAPVEDAVTECTCCLAQRVLFATGEAAPFLRSGGLGDVAGALPKALQAEGIDCRVIMPLYSAIPTTYTNTMRFVGKTYVGLGWRTQYCGIFESTNLEPNDVGAHDVLRKSDCDSTAR